MSQYFSSNSQYSSTSEVQEMNQEFDDPLFPGVTGINEVPETEDGQDEMNVDDEEVEFYDEEVEFYDEVEFDDEEIEVEFDVDDEELHTSSGEDEISFNVQDGISGLRPTDYPVLCRSIRIGSYKVHPNNGSPHVLVNLSTDAISFDVGILNNSQHICIRLTCQDITRFLMSFERSMPLLFVYTTASFGENIRKVLDLNSFETGSFDPLSNNEKIKVMTFLIDQITSDQCNFFRHCFPPEEKKEELNKMQANQVLMASTPFTNHLRSPVHETTPTSAFEEVSPTEQQVTPTPVQNAVTQKQGNRVPSQKIMLTATLGSVQVAPTQLQVTPTPVQNAVTQKQGYCVRFSILELIPLSIQAVPAQQQGYGESIILRELRSILKKGVRPEQQEDGDLLFIRQLESKLKQAFPTQQEEVTPTPVQNAAKQKQGYGEQMFSFRRRTIFKQAVPTQQQYGVPILSLELSTFKQAVPTLQQVTPTPVQNAVTQKQGCGLRVSFLEIRPVSKQAVPAQLLQSLTDLDGKTVLCIYPPPPQSDGITVTVHDLKSLDKENFVNDVIIEFYLKYIIGERLTSNQREKLYLFNSFFYPRLTQKAVESTPGQPPKLVDDESYKRVKKWTKNVDIFSKDFLVIPLVQRRHWFLVIICFSDHVSEVAECAPRSEVGSNEYNSKSRVFWELSNKGEGNKLNPDENSISSVNSTYLLPVPRDSDKPSEASDSTIPPDGETKKEMPCICIFDSLRQSNREEIAAALREYLEMEWRFRKGTTKVFNTNTMPSFMIDCPQQTNSHDCGLYLLQFVQSFFENPFPYFGNPMPDLRNWFSSLEMSGKRNEIINVIMSLYKEQFKA